MTVPSAERPFLWRLHAGQALLVVSPPRQGTQNHNFHACKCLFLPREASSQPLCLITELLVHLSELWEIQKAYLLVRCLGMDRACVDTALRDCVQVPDHLGLLSSNLTPSSALPCCLPLRGGGSVGASSFEFRFQVISIRILNYCGHGPRGSVSSLSCRNTNRKATQTH